MFPSPRWLRCGSLVFPCRHLCRPALSRKQLPPLHSRLALSLRLRRLSRSHAALLHEIHRNEYRFQASLLGFAQRSPLRRAPRVSTPGCPGSARYQLANSFRPCRSSRLRRFTPHEAVRVCCAPLSTMGFTWFSAVTRRCRPIPTFLTGAQALRSFPLSSSGFPVTRALPSRRCLHTHRSARFNPTSGVCSTGESVAVPPCCHVGPPEAPLGFPTISGSHHCLGIASSTLLTTEVTSCSTTEAVVWRGGLPAPHSCE